MIGNSDRQYVSGVGSRLDWFNTFVVKTELYSFVLFVLFRRSF